MLLALPKESSLKFGQIIVWKLADNFALISEIL